MIQGFSPGDWIALAAVAGATARWTVAGISRHAETRSQRAAGVAVGEHTLATIGARLDELVSAVKNAAEQFRAHEIDCAEFRGRVAARLDALSPRGGARAGGRP